MSTPLTAVLCAVRGATEQEVVRALDAARGAFHVSRRCADVAEVLGAAAAGHGAVAVVSDDLPGLDREVVRHLHGSSVWVVLLTSRPGADAAQRSRALGADLVVEGAQAETAVVPALTRLLTEAASTGARPGLALGAAPPAAADPLAEVPTPPQATPRGHLVAVWGPTGAPGRSTVALTLATELARGGDGRPPASTLLVDADTYGGTQAQALGLLDEAPGVAAAARAAATGRLDPTALAALTPRLDDGLRVLTGISRAERWPELPVAALEVVWQVARDLAAWTVVDTGFNLEQDEALSYDTRAPRRNGATLSALAEADVVVVVGAGDPIGLHRLVRALSDLDDLGVPSAVRRVVVNRVRPSASGPRPGDAIRSALLRYAAVSAPVLVPDDTAGCDAALLSARTLAEQAPTSPARRALAALASGLDLELRGEHVPTAATAGAH